MAQTIYVNTANGTSGDGTTNETDSSPDSAFKTLQEAEADLPATFTEDITIMCEGATDDTSAVTFTGYDVSTFTLTVIGDYSGFGWNDSEYILSTTDGGELQVSTDLILKNIQCINGGTNNTRWALQVNTLSAGDFFRAENCIFRITGTGGTGSYCVNCSDPAAVDEQIFVNCVFVNDLHDALITGGAVDGGTVLYNCTLYGNGGNGIRNDSQQALLKNCLSYNNTESDYSGGGAATGSVTNLSEDTTATTYSDSGGVNSATITFEDTANYDFRLVAGDTDAIGAATDLSGDSVFAFNTDAAGNTRSSWDIGAHEFQGGGAIHPIMHHIRQQE